jgi:hypothetical protein
LTLRCFVIRENELKKNKDRIAIVRSAVPDKMVLRPNESINVKGYSDRELRYHDTLVIVHECEEFTLPFLH